MGSNSENESSDGEKKGNNAATRKRWRRSRQSATIAELEAQQWSRPLLNASPLASEIKDIDADHDSSSGTESPLDDEAPMAAALNSPPSSPPRLAAAPRPPPPSPPPSPPPPPPPIAGAVAGANERRRNEFKRAANDNINDNDTVAKKLEELGRSAMVEGTDSIAQWVQWLNLRMYALQLRFKLSNRQIEAIFDSFRTFLAMTRIRMRFDRSDAGAAAVDATTSNRLTQHRPNDRLFDDMDDFDLDEIANKGAVVAVDVVAGDNVNVPPPLPAPPAAAEVAAGAAAAAAAEKKHKKKKKIKRFLFEWLPRSSAQFRRRVQSQSAAAAADGTEFENWNLCGGCCNLARVTDLWNSRNGDRTKCEACDTPLWKDAEKAPAAAPAPAANGRGSGSGSDNGRSPARKRRKVDPPNWLPRSATSMPVLALKSYLVKRVSNPTFVSLLESARQRPPIQPLSDFNAPQLEGHSIEILADMRDAKQWKVDHQRPPPPVPAESPGLGLGDINERKHAPAAAPAPAAAAPAIAGVGSGESKRAPQMAPKRAARRASAQPLPNENELCLSLSLSVDWFQSGKTNHWSNNSVGVMYLSILDLPRQVRNRELITFAMIPGPREPHNMQNIMKTLIEQVFLPLMKDGTNVDLPASFFEKGKEGHKTVRLKIRLSVLRCDVPGMAKVVGRQGHASCNGCHKCNFPLKLRNQKLAVLSVAFKDGFNLKKTTVADAPLIDRMTEAKVRGRTASEHEIDGLAWLDAETASAQKEIEAKSGFKWSVLACSELKWDVIGRVPFDPLHQLYLGVVRAFVRMLIDRHWLRKPTLLQLAKLAAATHASDAPKLARNIRMGFAHMTGAQWRYLVHYLMIPLIDAYSASDKDIEKTCQEAVKRSQSFAASRRTAREVSAEALEDKEAKEEADTPPALSDSDSNDSEEDSEGSIDGSGIDSSSSAGSSEGDEGSATDSSPEVASDTKRSSDVDRTDTDSGEDDSNGSGSGSASEDRKESKAASDEEAAVEDESKSSDERKSKKKQPKRKAIAMSSGKNLRRSSRISERKANNDSGTGSGSEDAKESKSSDERKSKKKQPKQSKAKRSKAKEMSDQTKSLIALITTEKLADNVFRHGLTRSKFEMKQAPTKPKKGKAKAKAKPKPKLVPILPSKQLWQLIWHTFYQLVRACQLIGGHSFRRCDVPFAKEHLKRFIAGCGQLFGESYVARHPNFHYILHLPDGVLQWGPMDEIWLFPEEREHRSLRATANNGKEVEGQMFRSAIRWQSLRHTSTDWSTQFPTLPPIVPSDVTGTGGVGSDGSSSARLTVAGMAAESAVAETYLLAKYWAASSTLSAHWFGNQSNYCVPAGRASLLDLSNPASISPFDTQSKRINQRTTLSMSLQQWFQRNLFELLAKLVAVPIDEDFTWEKVAAACTAKGWPDPTDWKVDIEEMAEVYHSAYVAGKYFDSKRFARSWLYCHSGASELEVRSTFATTKGALASELAAVGVAAAGMDERARRAELERSYAPHLADMPSAADDTLRQLCFASDHASGAGYKVGRLLAFYKVKWKINGAADVNWERYPTLAAAFKKECNEFQISVLPRMKWLKNSAVGQPKAPFESIGRLSAKDVVPVAWAADPTTGITTGSYSVIGFRRLKGIGNDDEMTNSQWHTDFDDRWCASTRVIGSVLLVPSRGIDEDYSVAFVPIDCSR